MRRSRWLGILMAITILAVTAFQIYWLRQNYLREQRNLSIKTNMLFREAVMQLQVSKLKLDGEVNGRIIMHNDDGEQIDLKIRPRQQKREIVSAINVIRTKLNDSLKGSAGRTPVMITIDRSREKAGDDTAAFRRTTPVRGEGPNRVFNLLYSVDSMQKPILVAEVDSAFASILREEKLVVPYRIRQVDSAAKTDDVLHNEITIGVRQPTTYQLQLGNVFAYLLRQITQPILFSILLLGITILSFVLLYRNLLRQQRLSALKNEFISNITHELKTPIATVGVAIEAMKNFNAMDDPRRTREYLDISQLELQRLSLLVDKVLKLSMFERKAIELKKEAVNLEEIVREVAGSLRLQLEKTKASITVHTEGDVTVNGDRMHLLSVVFNLVDNAIKYSSAPPVISISLTGNADGVSLTIEDNGIGIPAVYRDKIFDKFFRVPHGDTHNAKGHGLGLSYVAQVVAQHNGAIAVEPAGEAGTVFTIQLPKQS